MNELPQMRASAIKIVQFQNLVLKFMNANVIGNEEENYFLTAMEYGSTDISVLNPEIIFSVFKSKMVMYPFLPEQTEEW